MGYKVKKIYQGSNLVWPSGLPSAYQEVEYIQSSGTQDINTGYIPNQDTKIIGNISDWNKNVNRYGTIFGVRLDWSASGRGFMLGLDNEKNSGNAMFGTYYNDFSIGFGDGNAHKIEMGQNGIYVDDLLIKTLSSATFTSTGNLYIFGLNDNGSIKERGGFKLYHFQIYKSNILVRNFIPCYRKSDNVIGLYDTVNNQFYTNSGSGTFTKGPNV